MNLTSTEVAIKYGPEAVAGLKALELEMPDLLVGYVHPFLLPLGKTMKDAREEVLRSYNWKSNVRSKAEKWSRDGEYVYIYRGEDDDCPYEWKTSWTFQPSVALGFIHNARSGRLDKVPNKVVLKLKVPLSIIDTFGVWALDGASEIFIDPRHINFRDLYEAVEVYTEEECIDLNYHYSDSRYDYSFVLPHVDLCLWNEYPFNLTYPPYHYPEVDY